MNTSKLEKIFVLRGLSTDFGAHKLVTVGTNLHCLL